MNLINEESILLLCKHFKHDAIAIQLLQDCIQSFMEYGNRIYQLEIYQLLWSYDNTHKEDFQTKRTELDKQRTSAHNMVISRLSVLNRHCEQNGIPLVYDGTISNERPYRIEIAEAVLAYVRKVIERRQK